MKYYCPKCGAGNETINGKKPKFCSSCGNLLEQSFNKEASFKQSLQSINSQNSNNRYDSRRGRRYKEEVNYDDNYEDDDDYYDDDYNNDDDYYYEERSNRRRRNRYNISKNDFIVEKGGRIGIPFSEVIKMEKMSDDDIQFERNRRNSNTNSVEYKSMEDFLNSEKQSISQTFIKREI